MKYKRRLRKKRGFTIIETIVYVLLTTIILVEGIGTYTLIYKTYLEARKVSIKYDNLQSFYINLDIIATEGNIDDVYVSNNSIIFSKEDNGYKLNKTIKSNGSGEIVIKYTKGNSTQTINTMLMDIDDLKIQKKGNLIYFIIKDKDGKEFIRCL